VRLLLYWSLGLLLGITIGARCHGAERFANIKLLDVDRASYEYSKIADQRDFFYTEDQESFKYRMAFLLDFSIMKYLYWKNDVHMMATDSQVRAVGWEFEQGGRLGKYGEVFYYHHSQHVLERDRHTRQYPLENRYGFRINFIQK
jgi:hypothetical protein